MHCIQWLCLYRSPRSTENLPRVQEVFPPSQWTIPKSASMPTKQWLQVEVNNEIVIISMFLSILCSLDFKWLFVSIEAISRSIYSITKNHGSAEWSGKGSPFPVHYLPPRACSRKPYLPHQYKDAYVSIVRKNTLSTCFLPQRLN